MKIKYVLASIILLASSAYAGGPGTTEVRISEVTEVENFAGNFRIKGLTAPNQLVEITGPSTEYSDFIVSNFAISSFNNTSERRVDLILKVQFTAAASGVVPSGVTTSSLFGSSILQARMVKQGISFTPGRSTNAAGSKLGVSLVLFSPNFSYAIRGYDVEGNFSQVVGNARNDEFAKQCIAKMSDVLSTDDFQRRKVVTFNGVSTSTNTVGSSRLTTTNKVSRLNQCEVFRSNHLIIGAPTDVVTVTR